MTIELELEAAPDSEGNRGLLTRRDVRAALALARIVHPPREALSCLSAGAGVVLCEECKNLHFLVTARAPDPLFYSDGPSKKTCRVCLHKRRCQAQAYYQPKRLEREKERLGGGGRGIARGRGRDLTELRDERAETTFT